MTKEVGDILAIMAGTLVCVGAILIGIPTFSLENKLNNNNNSVIKKAIDTDDEEDKKITTNIINPNAILNTDLSKINLKNTDEDDPYAFRGGKRSRSKSRSKKSSRKSKTRKNK